jgi:hypothetical protein
MAAFAGLRFGVRRSAHGVIGVERRRLGGVAGIERDGELTVGRGDCFADGGFVDRRARGGGLRRIAGRGTRRLASRRHDERDTT